jgi:hypothetical protein
LSLISQSEAANNYFSRLVNSIEEIEIQLKKQKFTYYLEFQIFFSKNVETNHFINCLYDHFLIQKFKSLNKCLFYEKIDDLTAKNSQEISSK